jgi:hypothetical protein
MNGSAWEISIVQANQNSTRVLVTGPSILVYIFIENQKMHQNNPFAYPNAPTCFGLPTPSSGSSYDTQNLLSSLWGA